MNDIYKIRQTSTLKHVPFSIHGHKTMKHHRWKRKREQMAMYLFRSLMLLQLRLLRMLFESGDTLAHTLTHWAPNL